MKEYRQLITSVYDRLDSKTEQNFFVNNSEYDRLEEHNLWTYWQGRGVRHPKIMVVGQDWGSVEQSKKYLDYPEICSYPYEELYFTNLIPGFRNDTSSTGKSADVQKKITKDILSDFKQLLEVLQPKFVISLGKLVSENIDRAYNGAESVIAKAGNFNEFLDEELNADDPKPVGLDLGDGKEIKMFALAHMGGLGKANRTRFFRKNQIQKTIEDDWKVVANYIKAN